MIIFSYHSKLGPSGRSCIFNFRGIFQMPPRILNNFLSRWSHHPQQTAILLLSLKRSSAPKGTHKTEEKWSGGTVFQYSSELSFWIFLWIYYLNGIDYFHKYFLKGLISFLLISGDRPLSPILSFF